MAAVDWQVRAFDGLALKVEASGLVAPGVLRAPEAGESPGND
jgi:hypothetical protein